jgi:methylmalonyl-CoA mutase cobalamin-binding subunit
MLARRFGSCSRASSGALARARTASLERLARRERGRRTVNVLGGGESPTEVALACAAQGFMAGFRPATGHAWMSGQSSQPGADPAISR